MKRRETDVLSGADLSCVKCVEAKKIGFPRPTCEDCGKIRLTRNNSFIIWLLEKYYHSIVIRYGKDSWGVNIEVLRFLAQEYKVDSVLELFDRITLYLGKVIVEVPNKEEQDRDKGWNLPLSRPKIRSNAVPRMKRRP